MGTLLRIFKRQMNNPPLGKKQLSSDLRRRRMLPKMQSKRRFCFGSASFCSRHASWTAGKCLNSFSRAHLISWM
jgi:hypothetical protein